MVVREKDREEFNRSRSYRLKRIAASDKKNRVSEQKKLLDSTRDIRSFRLKDHLDYLAVKHDIHF